MPVKCKECGSFSVELDSLSTEENLVCTSCGVIFDSSSFENIPCLKGTSFVHDDQGVQYSKGKSEGLDKIKQLAGLFCLSVDMQDSAKRLFSFAYRKIFLKDLITTKIILAGCCVYFELRENQHSVLISDLCDHLQCTPFKFNAVLHSLEKLIGKKAPPHSVKDLVPVILKDIAFDRKQEVFKQTMRILDFCSECWLVSGRSRDSTIIAVSYVAWKSLDFSHAWITFPKYLSTFEFPKKNYHTAAERVKEIIAVFITHAEKLPWISKGTVNKNNVSLHIDDVLKYFRSLHNDVISDIDSKACSDIDSKACSDIDSKACSDIDSKACNGDMQVFNEFRPKTKRSLARMATQSYDQVPPSSGCENSDESILDSEIDTYIRSDKEVSELIKVQMKMAPSLGCEDLP